uniref:Uncharacterized protein n=1 Tax=Setaria viridis TaxID=4556 RepID=A0A4U6T2D0_SETVI|nr:hypothetical protein SEVIR_9G322550v2 [Setaria viridis]
MLSPSESRRGVSEALHDGRWIRDITGSLSVAAIVDYLQIWDAVTAIQLAPEREDRFMRRWTANGTYTARSAYKMLHQGTIPLRGANRI